LCSWDLLCCSSHTENQHNPKIWGWSMKRNHLGISSWFHRRYDTVPTPCWSILLLISSSPIARNSQKKTTCVDVWLSWLIWLPPSAQMVQSCYPLIKHGNGTSGKSSLFFGGFPARLMGHRAQRAFSAAKKSNTWQWTPKISSHLVGNPWSSYLLIYLDPRRFRNV
jgi:hypothetical protein